MAERRAANKYYPPDWDPSHGSLNHYIHAIKQGRSFSTSADKPPGPAEKEINTVPEISKKLRKVRIELPFPIWCAGCDRHLARNVRFNAEKAHIGHYHTTPLYEFAFTCPSCPQVIILATDPSATDYKVVSGAKRKTETIDEEMTTVNDDPSNPFAVLEGTIDKAKAAAALQPGLQQLEEAQVDAWQDDFSRSRKLRKRFREEKRVIEGRNEEVLKAMKKFGLSSTDTAKGTSGKAVLKGDAVIRTFRRPRQDQSALSLDFRQPNIK